MNDTEKKYQVAIIAAIADNGVIGQNNPDGTYAIPWQKIKEDMNHFRTVTLDNVIIMGRKTWDSLPVKPLDRRTNIVLTRKEMDVPGVFSFNSLDDALKFSHKAHAGRHAYVIGGAEVYSQALPLADILDLTRVHIKANGNVLFPQVNFKEWKKIASKKMAGAALEYTFETYIRR